jgi:hypothetical protein
MADLQNDGMGARNSVFSRKEDCWDRCGRFLRRSLLGLGFRRCAQLTCFLPLGLAHAANLPEVPRRCVHLEAGLAGGQGKKKHASQ